MGCFRRYYTGDVAIWQKIIYAIVMCGQNIHRAEEKMKPTIREIAKMAGTSPSSVSLVLNNKPGVRSEMRKQIQQVLLENGYTLKKPGEQFREKKNICFIYYKSTNWIANRKDNFLPRVLEGIERGCAANNCSVYILNTDYSNVSKTLSSIQQDEADGIIFLGTEYAHGSEKLLVPKQVPFVCIDRYFDEEPIESINIDNIGSMYTTIRHLMELGHRRIGYLTGDLESGAIRHRNQIFRQVMERLGLDVQPEHIVCMSVLREEAEISMETYIKQQKDLPTAYVTCNDVIAMAAIGMLKRAGYSVPDDISIVGFDNSGICDMVFPGITTVHANLEGMGEMAVGRLLSLMENNEQDVLKTTIGTKLICRGTTAPVK